MISKYKHSGSDFLIPDLEKNAQALINWGYTLEQSISDLIDNSLDAEATKIHIIFFVPKNGRIRMELHDNGIGMSGDKLKEAMRQGSKTTKSQKELGKYGFGLKIASLNQSDTLHVVTRQTKPSSRKISKESLKKGYECFIYDDKTSLQMWKELEFFRKGTIVIWEEMNKFPEKTADENNKILDRIRTQLNNHLGLVFHRFLESELEISMETREESQNYERKSLILIPCIDPFGYKKVEAKNLSTKKAITLGDSKATIKLHIWPRIDTTNENSTNYKLAGGANDAQGLYIYRNKRLIQKGGWGHELSNDPHLSLARVEVEVIGDSNEFLQVDVTKTKASLTNTFYDLITKTKFKIGNKSLNLSEFRSYAQEIYRKTEKLKAKEYYFNGSGTKLSDGIAVTVEFKKMKPNIQLIYNKKLVLQLNLNLVNKLKINASNKDIFTHLIFTSIFNGLNENSSKKAIESRVKKLQEVLQKI
jgi:hypothetical protein